MKTFEDIMAEYKQLSSLFQQSIRQFAVHTLLDRGAEEVGSSDVNHQIVQLYNQHGSFEHMMTYYTEYLFG